MTFMEGDHINKEDFIQLMLIIWLWHSFERSYMYPIFSDSHSAKQFPLPTPEYLLDAIFNMYVIVDNCISHFVDNLINAI